MCVFERACRSMDTPACVCVNVHEQLIACFEEREMFESMKTRY